MNDLKKTGYNLEKQHKNGKWHAIERIVRLLDKGSFSEIGQDMTDNMCQYPYDGVITGYGSIGGHVVFVYAQDFTVGGGTVGSKHAEKIARVIALAIENNAPVIGINDSGGARIQEGAKALSGYGRILRMNAVASGCIPQIAIIAGPCAGGAVYSPGMMDFIFMVKDISSMYVTGPKVIEQVTGKKCRNQELGGWELHARKSGVAHFVCETEAQCYEQVRTLISLLQNHHVPDLGTGKSKVRPCSRLHQIVPASSRKIYDMLEVIRCIVDQENFLEVQKLFAVNVIVGFGKISGMTIGIVANQPMSKAGVLDCDGSDKAAGFVRFCDAFQIPIVTLVDVPGFMPDKGEEEKGIIRHGSKLLFAYAEATTTKITVILRKAYGGAFIAMGSRSIGADLVFAWPGAEVAVMGAAGAVDILYHHELEQHKEQPQYRKEREEAYEKEFVNSRLALAEGIIDKEIPPEDTRKEILSGLKLFAQKKSTLSVINSR